jgi:hypothetical protein
LQLAAGPAGSPTVATGRRRLACFVGARACLPLPPGRLRPERRRAAFSRRHRRGQGRGGRPEQVDHDQRPGQRLPWLQAAAPGSLARLALPAQGLRLLGPLGPLPTACSPPGSPRHPNCQRKRQAPAAAAAGGRPLPPRHTFHLPARRATPSSVATSSTGTPGQTRPSRSLSRARSSSCRSGQGRLLCRA